MQPTQLKRASRPTIQLPEAAAGAPRTPWFLKPFIRLLSFVIKEINEVSRQPRLVLSLLLGPFLILALFGVGYRGSQPVLRTAIVLPPDAEIDAEAIKQIGGLNFTLLSVGGDREAALAMLERGEVDVVQVIPPDIQSRVLAGEQPPVEFIYDEVNPLNEQWIQYLAYAEVVEINKMVLLDTTGQVQGEARTTRDQLAAVRSELDTLDAGLASAEQAELEASVERLKAASALLAAGGLATGAGGEAVRRDAEELRADLEAIEQAVNEGRLAEQRARIQSARERVDRLEQATGQFSDLPPQVIVSPLRQTYENRNGASYNLMTFYAPSVVALLMQHIAVTLGSLSLVRERLLGAVEIFRVAPVTARQVLVGKYLGYLFFIAIIVGLLMLLMRLLGIPFLGDPLTFAGVALLLALASLGVGFVISAVSRTDSQAVQLSMLVLLLSIFFGGFFLPLENFWEGVRAVSYCLPLTHGVVGFQDVLLRGRAPDALTWIGLGTISGVTFLTALTLLWRELRRP